MHPPMRSCWPVCLVLPLLALACSSDPTSSVAAGDAGADVGATVPVGSDGGDVSSPLDGGASSSSSGSTSSSQLSLVDNFGDNPGRLRMYLYAPAKPRANAAVVVALHGCGQTALDHVSVGWNAFADAWGFYVIYPEQQAANNATRCFNWFDPTKATRDAGEAASIAQMVQKVRADQGAGRAFATGVSAGGAMTAVMLAAYPDVFEAGAVHAGIPFGCALNVGQAVSCLSGGTKKTAQEWGDLVRAAHTQVKTPRVQIWHGSADTTVRAGNLAELTKQWTNVAGIADAPSDTSTLGPASRKVYKDKLGVVQVETFEVAGMAHGTAIKSGTEEGVTCGKPDAYILDEGICSTYYSALFFGLK
jgi:poly(hydroxyalkanoate) depolymerase family esterase